MLCVSHLLMRIFHRRSSCWADRQEKRFYWFVPLTSCFFLLLLFPITFYLLLLYSLVSLVFVYLQTTSVIPCKYYWGIYDVKALTSRDVFLFRSTIAKYRNKWNRFKTCSCKITALGASSTVFLCSLYRMTDLWGSK